MAGQSAEVWQPCLWWFPHQQRVGDVCCSLLLQVGYQYVIQELSRSIRSLLMVFLLKLNQILHSDYSTSPSRWQVSLGRQSLQGSNLNEVSRTVARIILHPSYDSTTSDNDIALLRLSSPVTFTDYIRPVCLAASDSIFNNGTDSWVTGWGAVQEGGESACCSQAL